MGFYCDSAVHVVGCGECVLFGECENHDEEDDG